MYFDLKTWKLTSFKIERFTDLHTQDHITALLEHLVGKTFSISYVTDLDHAYIRVIKERPITTTFPAAANVLIAELLEDFLFVYDVFHLWVTYFPFNTFKERFLTPYPASIRSPTCIFL